MFDAFAFGCSAYARVPKVERHKLNSKVRRCLMLGYGANKKGYRLYDLDWSKVFLHSRVVVFDETCLPGIQRNSPLLHMCSSKLRMSPSAPNAQTAYATEFPPNSCCRSLDRLNEVDLSRFPFRYPEAISFDLKFLISHPPPLVKMAIPRNSS